MARNSSSWRLYCLFSGAVLSLPAITWAVLDLLVKQKSVEQAAENIATNWDVAAIGAAAGLVPGLLTLGIYRFKKGQAAGSEGFPLFNSHEAYSRGASTPF